MTIGDLHRISSVSASAIYAWENGNRTPEVQSLRAIVAALRVPMADLIPIPEPDRTLADLRVLAQLTQVELAARIRIPTPAWSKIERAERNLPDTLAERAAAELGVTVDDVMRGYRNAAQRAPGTPA